MRNVLPTRCRMLFMLVVAMFCLQTQAEQLSIDPQEHQEVIIATQQGTRCVYMGDELSSITHTLPEAAQLAGERCPESLKTVCDMIEDGRKTATYDLTTRAMHEALDVLESDHEEILDDAALKTLADNLLEDANKLENDDLTIAIESRAPRPDSSTYTGIPNEERDDNIDRDLFVGYNGRIEHDLYVGNDLRVMHEIDVFGDAYFNKNIKMQNTNDSTEGSILKGTSPNFDRFIHNYGTNNTFMGINSGNYTTTGATNSGYGVQTLTANTSGTSNVAVGALAMQANTTGGFNTAVGVNSMLSNTSGASNTAVGIGTLQANVSGTNNVAMGSNALTANTASGNTGIGTNALAANTSGTPNTAFGFNALASNTTGSVNIAVGAGAMELNALAANNLAVGNNALSTLSPGTVGWGGENTAIGHNTLQNNVANAADEGKNNTALGYNALNANTSGHENTAIGAYTLDANLAGSDNVALGYNALTVNTASENTAIGSGAAEAVTSASKITAVGYNALNDLSINSNSTAVGHEALAQATGALNTAVGSAAMAGAVVSGGNNVAVGYNSQNALTSGIKNVSLGNSTLSLNSTGNNNIALGHEAGDVITTGENNIIIGANSDPSAAGTDYELVLGTGVTGLGANTIVIGNSANYNDTYMPTNLVLPHTAAKSGALNGYTGVIYKDTDRFIHDRDSTNATFSAYVGSQSGNLTPSGTASSNTALGYQTLTALNVGSNNVAIGHGSMSTADGSGASSIDNSVAVGRFTLGSVAEIGDNNVAVGDQAMRYAIGENNVAVGARALDGAIGSLSEGSHNIAIGSDSLGAPNMDGNYNIGIGISALTANTDGTNNIAIGRVALTSNTVAQDNLAIGTNSLTTLNPTNELWGRYNTAIGHNTLQNNVATSISEGSSNTAIGYDALTTNTKGDSNTATGASALTANTEGNYNTAFGSSALAGNTTGDENVALGFGAGSTITGGSNNIMIGTNAEPAAATNNYEIVIGDNVTGNGPNTITIGSSANYTDTYLPTNLRLPDTTSNSTGIVYKGANTFIHNRDTSSPTPVPAFSLYVGSGAGNLSPSGVTGSNTGFGYMTLSELNVGSNNVAIGHEALGNVKDADGANNPTSSNVAVGRFALGGQTAVKLYNTAIGDEAMRDATGGQNTALGRQALYAATGDYNIGIGHQAGNGITSGENNIIIGAGADSSASGTNYEIVIGTNATGLGTGNIVLGNPTNTDSPNYTDTNIYTDRTKLVPRANSGTGTPRPAGYAAVGDTVQGGTGVGPTPGALSPLRILGAVIDGTAASGDGILTNLGISSYTRTALGKYTITFPAARTGNSVVPMASLKAGFTSPVPTEDIQIIASASSASTVAIEIIDMANNVFIDELFNVMILVEN